MGIVTPRPSLRQIGGRQTWVPIGSRGLGAPGSFSDTPESTATSFADTTMFVSPANCYVHAIKLGYAGWDELSSGPQDRAVTITGAASVVRYDPAFNLQLSAGALTGATQITVNSVYGIRRGQVVKAQGNTNIPDNTFVTDVAPGSSTSVVTLSAALVGGLSVSQVVSFTGAVLPARFGGRKQLLVEPGRDFIWSDPIPMPLPPGTSFGVKTWGAISGGSSWFLQQGGNSGSAYAAGDSFTKGAGIADNTGNAVKPATTAGSGKWGPPVILGLVDRPVPAVAGVGDSIIHGIGDVGDSAGRTGFFQRALANNVCWLSMGRGSTTITQMARDVNGLSVEASLTDVGVTHAVLEHCRNDLVGVGTTAANTIAALQAVAADLIARGIKVFVCTSVPFTSSTDGWVSAGNQTIPNSVREAERVAFNASMRSGFAALGFYGLVDLASVVEDATNAGKWKSAGGSARTGDGTHPNQTGVDEIIAAGIITPSMFAL